MFTLVKFHPQQSTKFIINSEAEEVFKLYLSQQKPRIQEGLILHYAFNLPPHTIATRLNVSRAAVTHWLNKFKKYIKDESTLEPPCS